MEKQYRSSIIKNHKTIEKDFFMVFPSKGYVASSVIFSSEPEIKKSIVGISSD